MVSDEQGTGLSIAFSLEELVVLGELCDLSLPMLGERPLSGLVGVAREAVLDVAARSLLARGVLVRSGDTVGLVSAAAGLLEIVSASSLRVEVIVDRDGGRRWHTIHAIPYAAVDVSIDLNSNHRFAPFATEDLLLHVGALTGLLEVNNPDGDSEDARPDGEPVSLLFGDWRAARSGVRVGSDADALATLIDSGPSAAVAGTLLEVLRSIEQSAAVQIVHHPSPTTSAGGEVAWVDSGAHGIWLIPTIDQPFGRLLPGDERDDAGLLGRSLAVGPGDENSELDGIVVTIAPTTKVDVLQDLLSVLPKPA